MESQQSSFSLWYPRKEWERHDGEREKLEQKGDALEIFNSLWILAFLAWVCERNI